MIRQPPRSTLFPSTPLFRSHVAPAALPALPLPVPLPLAARHPRGVERLGRSEEHTSELQSQSNLVCRLLLEKKKERVSRVTRVPTQANPNILREYLIEG